MRYGEGVRREGNGNASKWWHLRGQVICLQVKCGHVCAVPPRRQTIHIGGVGPPPLWESSHRTLQSIPLHSRRLLLSIIQLFDRSLFNRADQVGPLLTKMQGGHVQWAAEEGRECRGWDWRLTSKLSRTATKTSQRNPLPHPSSTLPHMAQPSRSPFLSIYPLLSPPTPFSTPPSPISRFAPLACEAR